jgi:HrpA-like RNA helicase
VKLPPFSKPFECAQTPNPLNAPKPQTLSSRRGAILKSLEQLYALGALTSEGRLSAPTGVQMARFPLEPLYSRAVLTSAKMGCLEEMITVVAMLSVEGVFYVPKEKRSEVGNKCLLDLDVQSRILFVVLLFCVSASQRLLRERCSHARGKVFSVERNEQQGQWFADAHFALPVRLVEAEIGTLKLSVVSFA